MQANSSETELTDRYRAFVQRDVAPLVLERPHEANASVYFKGRFVDDFAGVLQTTTPGELRAPGVGPKLWAVIDGLSVVFETTVLRGMYLSLLAKLTTAGRDHLIDEDVVLVLQRMSPVAAAVFPHTFGPVLRLDGVANEGSGFWPGMADNLTVAARKMNDAMSLRQLDLAAEQLFDLGLVWLERPLTRFSDSYNGMGAERSPSGTDWIHEIPEIQNLIDSWVNPEVTYWNVDAYEGLLSRTAAGAKLFAATALRTK